MTFASICQDQKGSSASKSVTRRKSIRAHTFTILFSTSKSLTPILPFHNFCDWHDLVDNKPSHTFSCDKRFWFIGMHTTEYSVAYTYAFKKWNQNWAENRPELVSLKVLNSADKYTQRSSLKTYLFLS